MRSCSSFRVLSEVSLFLLGILFDLVLLLGLVPVGADELVDLLLEGHGDDGGEDEGRAHHVHPFGNHFKKCHLKSIKDKT
jgi:hypothetical protein